MADFASSIIGHFGESLGKEILSSMEKEQTHALVLNEERLSKEAFKSLFPAVREHPFIENAFYYDKADYDFGKSILHASGAIYIQDASAMMPVHFLNPKRGDTCIDLCAAPGGKTIDASLKIGMEGSIVSNDLSFPRAKELSSNIERLGLGNTIIMSVQPSLLSKFYGPTFDNVILDAPCSGSAMFRKNELSESDWTENKVLGNAKTQRELLEIAYSLLKEGGRLVYSTCSFSREENEDNIDYFLSIHDDMELIELPDNPCFYHPSNSKGMVYLLPCFYEGEGQFVALMKKKGDMPSIKRKAKFKENKAIKEFASSFGYEPSSIVEINEAYYGYDGELPLMNSPSPLRVGVKIAEKAKTLIPDYALSHFLKVKAIGLSLDEARRYLAGETLSLNTEDGFHIVSYNQVNLGYIKITHGLGKNHYPKGLRHIYKYIGY